MEGERWPGNILPVVLFLGTGTDEQHRFVFTPLKPGPVDASQAPHINVILFGSSKIVPCCTLPLTAMKAVDMIITDLAVFSFSAGALALRELMPGATLEEVRVKTAATFVEYISAAKAV